MKNEMTLTFSAISANEAFARNAVAAFCVTIKTTIDENTVHIVVSDYGIGIEDIEHAMQPFFTTKPDQERSGMGFTVMESFMDTLSVGRNEPNGTVVTMTKTIRGADWKEKKR